MATPVPLRLTTAVGFVDEVLVMVNVPVTAPAAVGSNCTLRVAVWLGFKVSGKLAPETLKPLPATTAEFTVTAAVPVEDSVTDCVVGVFTFTLPKATVVALMLSVGTPAALNCRAKVFATLFALAVRVTVVAVLTDDTVAEKLAELEPAATVTEAGTVTALLLLARPTANPPVAAAAFNVTVQLSVPAPVIEPLLQVRPVSTGKPVPLRLTVGFDDAVLVMVNVPVTAPAAVGSNCTVKVAVWLGFRVSGKVAPETLKPLPATVAEFTVTA